MTMWQKIRTMVRESDFVIGDLTDNNENVAYEIGLAHGFEREVILITRGEFGELPTDTSPFGVFQYTFITNEEFIRELNIAVEASLASRHNRLYGLAMQDFHTFQAGCATAVPASKDIFITRLKAAETVSRVVTDSEFMNCVVDNHREESIVQSLLAFAPAAIYGT